MSGRYVALLLLSLCFTVLVEVMLFPSALAKSKPSPSIAATSDPGYMSALAAANRFLQADEAKQHSSADGLEAFFSSGSDAAYEIAHGKKLAAGRYTFPVTLFAFHSGPTDSTRPQKSEIVVVRAGKDEWAIDKLP